MLKAEEIRIDVGRARATGGDFIGDFMRVIHLPTGISRSKGPPLGRESEFRRQALREIEAELQEKGMTQYLLPDLPLRKRRRR